MSRRHRITFLGDGPVSTFHTHLSSGGPFFKFLKSLADYQIWPSYAILKREKMASVTDFDLRRIVQYFLINFVQKMCPSWTAVYY